MAGKAITPLSLPFEDPRTVLRRYGIVPKRAYSQNFLISPQAVEQIARLCADQPGRLIVEIGAGLGTLTRALLSLGAQVIAIEKDMEMCAVLSEELGGTKGFELKAADVTQVDLRACFGQKRGVLTGNLPYQITGLILRRMAQPNLAMDAAVLMVQQEVANRLVAGPGSKERGALSAMMQIRFELKIALRLSPGAFFPQPKVNSSVVTFKPRVPDLVSADLDLGLFDRVVKAAFCVRRKTLRNALTAGGIGPVAQVEHLLEAARIDPRRRAEQLTNEEFVALTLANASLF